MRSATAKSYMRCRFTQKPAPLPNSLPKTNRHLGGDRLLLVEDAVERLSGNPERIGDGRLAHAKCGQDVLAENLSGMRRIYGSVSFDHQR